jgi:hypothetical protein
MNDEILRLLWTRAGPQAPLSREEVDGIIAGGLRQSFRQWAAYVYIHLAGLVATVVFGVLGAFGYASNPSMLAAEIGVTLVASSLIPFGVHVLRELARIDRGDEPVLEALRHRLRFYTTTYEMWMWATGLTTAMLAFVVATNIDNQDGHYPINDPVVFWGILVGMVVFIYGAAKLASYPVVREMCDALIDLREGTSERLARVPEQRRRWMRWRVAATLALAVLGALGVLVALMLAR